MTKDTSGRRFAWNIATSASRMSSSPDSAREPAIAMPMLAVTDTLRSRGVDRSPDVGQDALGERDDVGLVGDVLADDDELVAAQPGHGVARPQRRVDAARDADQHLVADVVAERVVDVLEPVEVDEQHGDGARAAVRAGQRGVEPVAQQPPVRQVGQAVVQRRVHEHALGVAPARGVVEADQRRVRPALGQRHGRHDGPHVVTLLVAQPPLAGAGAEPARRRRRRPGTAAASRRGRRRPGRAEVRERGVGLEDSPRCRRSPPCRPGCGRRPRARRRRCGARRGRPRLPAPGPAAAVRRPGPLPHGPMVPVTQRVCTWDRRRTRAGSTPQ